MIWGKPAFHMNLKHFLSETIIIQKNTWFAAIWVTVRRLPESKLELNFTYLPFTSNVCEVFVGLIPIR